MSDHEFEALLASLASSFVRNVDIVSELDYLLGESVRNIQKTESASLKQRWANEMIEALREFRGSQRNKGHIVSEELVRITWDKKLKMKKANRRAQHIRRLQHLAAYGSVCSNCGENRWECLSIDHTSGGGASERKLHGKGDNLLRYLRKHNYPPGYRVLCHNCNTSLQLYGYFPAK